MHAGRMSAQLNSRSRTRVNNKFSALTLSIPTAKPYPFTQHTSHSRLQAQPRDGALERQQGEDLDGRVLEDLDVVLEEIGPAHVREAEDRAHALAVGEDHSEERRRREEPVDHTVHGVRAEVGTYVRVDSAE